MILEGPWYVQAIKAGLAILFIGTFVWKMIRKEWWWEHLKRQAK